MRRTIIWLFVIALSIRAVIAVLQMMYGINDSLNLDQYIYGTIGGSPGLEIYHDFYGYYVVQLADLSKGLIPYKDFAYSYPPLFLYTLYPFYSFAGSHAASIPIWLSDAATAPLVYLLAQRFTSRSLSVVAGVAYAVSPFFLLYEGYLWFSSQPMTFFIVLSLYLLFTNRPLWSAATFAVSVLYKQELLILLPIYLICYAKNFPRPVLWKCLVLITAIIISVSLPFILTTPSGYLTEISYGVLAHNFPPSLDLSGTSTISQLANSYPSSSTSSSLVCNTISGTWRSLVCNFGGFTYTDAKLNPSWTVIFNPSFINLMSTWIFFPLLAATLYNLTRLRRDGSALLLFGAVLLTLLLATFAFDIHSIYRYYLIPVYILPLVCARTRLSISLAVAVPLLSLIAPSGFVQLFFPLLDVLVVLLVNQKSAISPMDIKTYGSIPFRPRFGFKGPLGQYILR